MLIMKQSIQEMNSLNKFDNFLGLLNFFHVSRCHQISCSQCSFATELRQLWTKVYNGEGAVFTLQHFLRENSFNFDCARHFISKLAELFRKN